MGDVFIDKRAPLRQQVFGKDKGWWIAAVTYYNAGSGCRPVPLQPVIDGFESGHFLKGMDMIKIIDFWNKHKSQADLLLPEPKGHLY